MNGVRALLANEAGGGRGHVALLAAAARALGPEVARIAAIGRLRFAGELTGVCDRVAAAPLLARPGSAPRTFDLRGSATWGDVLAEIGLADPVRLRRGLRFWRDLIVAEDISLLIADFAPLALRAALGLREEGWAIRIVSLGTGYSAPPSGLAGFPVFLADHDRITHAEGATLALVNDAGRELGWTDLPRLAALYDVDLSLAATFAFLDPYRAWRPATGRTAPLVRAAPAPAGRGNGVFVYASTAEALDEPMVEALATLPHPRRGFLPRAPQAVAQRLSASGMELLDHPASEDEIAAYAGVIVHTASHGTICMAALAGLPQVGIPRHLEQLHNARQMQEMGILHLVEAGSADLRDRIAKAAADAALAARARAVADRLRRDHPDDPIAALAERLRPEIEAAAATL